MIVTINDEYRIASDEENWKLQQLPERDPNHHRRKHSDSPLKWKTIGYYRNLESLINDMMQRRLRLSGLETGPDTLRQLNAFCGSIQKDVGNILAAFSK